MPSLPFGLAAQFRNFALLAILFCIGSQLQGQINTGRITGTVRDSSGGVVVGAHVAATNDGTGVITPGDTSDLGEYFINFLTPGTYHLTAEKAGFQRELISNVVVNAGGIARFDFTLKPGQVLETMQVSADALQVATESSELSQTFSAKELDRLPNLDRNPLYQVNLMPGSNNGTGSGNYGQNGGENGSAIGQTRNQLSSLGGVDANANSVFIEGVANREPQNAYVGQAPPIDSIQELQVYTGKYNAEFGFSGSAVINVVTKSGTNAFHGSLYEYLRNNATDALPHDIPTTNTTYTLNPFHRNQFGGSFGGPVLKTKLFFFGDYQETRLNTSSLGTDTAPTPKMQQGDFSELYNSDLCGGSTVDDFGQPCGQLYWPGSQVRDSSGNFISAKPITGNIIPSTYWDPAAAKINAAALWGTANQPGVDGVLFNLGFTVGNVQRVRQSDERVDWNRTEADHYFFRYSMLRASLTDVNDINQGNQITGNTQFWNNGQADSNSFNQNMQVTNQHSFSGVTMNEVRLGYNRTAVHTSNASMAKDWNNFFGIPNGNLGDVGTRGMADFGPGWCCNGVNPLHTFGDPDWVGYVISNTFSAVDNFTVVKARHTIKFGTIINHVESSSADTIGGDNPRGSLFFDPAMTSFDGVSTGFAYAAFLLGFDSSAARAHFVTGTPYQTFWQMAWYGQDDFKITPSLTLNLGLRYELSTRPVDVSNRQANWDTRTNQLVVASPTNRSPALGLDKSDVGPRLGFAWTPDRGKTSLRGGYGVSYWQTYWSGPVTILGLGYPFYAKQDLISTNNMTPDLSLSGNPGLTPAAASGLGYTMVPFANAGLPVASAVYDSAGRLQIPANATIRATDYNWKSQRVDQTSLNLQRELKPGLIAEIGYLRVIGKNNNLGKNINQAPPNPLVSDNQTVNRPLFNQYPQLGDLQAQFSEGTSWYNALTARLQGRVMKLVTLNLNYAYGRTFANGNNPSWLLNDLNYKRGPAPQDIEHTFNGQFVFDVPVGKGKMYGANMNKVADAIVGGWQYSGYLRWNTGPRFTVSQYCTYYNNGSGPMPDRIGNGNLSRSQRTLARWFDTSAFVRHGCDGSNLADPANATDGSEGTNPLFADGQVLLDSSLSKFFHLTEKYSLEFRADAFNTLNHTNWGIPDANVEDGATFGEVTSASTTNRQMQFGLHLTF
ncbi:MAG TPA: TonB-dependent receptor [Candidatus Sulfotelmatobacter sp.]|nr:TonB-dependent receptor [Candidatus Sulfotelmatobacter sp.]